MLGRRHQPRSKGIALDIRANGTEVRIILDRKTPVASLINVPFAGRVIMRVITHGMSAGYSTHKITHPPVGFRRQHEVPMIGHQRVGKQPDRVSLKALGQNPLECFVVGILVENRATPLPRFRA